LECKAFNHRRQQRVGRATNFRRFVSHIGAKPDVYARLFVDLQTTNELDAQIDASEVNVVYFLLTINFLMRYAVESDLAGDISMNRQFQKWVWFLARVARSAPSMPLRRRTNKIWKWF
jgi:hypothetical protein